jgi:hypothetical protein
MVDGILRDGLTDVYDGIHMVYILQHILSFDLDKIKNQIMHYKQIYKYQDKKNIFEEMRKNLKFCLC